MNYVCVAQQITLKRAQSAHILSVRLSMQTWPKKKLTGTSLTTTVACARPVQLVTMHLALCLQMPGMMVGMDQKDGKIWHYIIYNELRVAPEEYPVLPKSA